MTQVEALARLLARASFDDLSPQSRKQLPVHILDSSSCSSAFPAVQACREQVAEFRGTDPCALIGCGKMNQFTRRSGTLRSCAT